MAEARHSGVRPKDCQKEENVVSIGVVMQKFFDTTPAALAWGTLLLLVMISWKLPVWAAIFIILFDIYWLLKTIYLSFHLQHTFRVMRRSLREDWQKKLNGLSVGEDSNSEGKNWKDIYHLIVIPYSSEPYEVVTESVHTIANSRYPKDRMIVVLSGEARYQENAQYITERIQNEFSGVFFKLLTTIHPIDLHGEIPGKGANETWAARYAKREIIDKLSIPYERILVSAFDSDTNIYPEYFGVLTHTFLTAKHPHRSSYQPIPLFVNNIYQAPAFARVIAFSATFWHMMQQARPERMTTFSSHAMPFRALVDIGFWQTDVVSEDSRIFWQCYLHYGGDWRVESLYYPVAMDANVAPTFWKTLWNLYKQQRRWGWGVENVPYMLTGFFRPATLGLTKKIAVAKKLYWSFITIEGFHSWATNAIIIFALGWLPLLLGGQEFSQSVLSYSLPQITRYIMAAASIGIVTAAITSIFLLPREPEWVTARHYVLYIIQWALMPFTLIIFGALPGLEAQTRLMLGGRFRLGFWITPKDRER